jgi:hypothetical protein
MTRNARASCPSLGSTLRQDGQVLLVVLVILLVVAASSASFIWFVNQQQTRAGIRYRDLAALRLAEAGVYRALAVLEATWPAGADPDHHPRPASWEESVTVGAIEGRLSVALTRDSGGAMLVTSRAEVGGAVRRLGARVSLASPALLAALYGAAVVQFDQPPAALFILPYGAGLADRPWFHIVAGKEVSFVHTRVVLNEVARMPDPFPGPVDPPEVSRRGPSASMEPVQILLANDARLTLQESSVTIAQLRVAGLRLDDSLRRTERLPPLPAVDREYYRAMASGNTANAALNRAAGRFAGDPDLEQKSDSQYTRDEMANVLAYLRTLLQPPALRGVLYVQGRVTVPPQSHVHIVDGALVAESTVTVDQGAELRVTHGPSTRSLPGIVTLEHGALIVARDARLRVHGLIYANRVFDTAPGALVEVVGSLVSNDPSISIRANAATMVIRYDPAVLGTPGLIATRDAPVIAWVTAWEELPR